ncbi:hypothetical protein Fcan01_25359 [Folsomia candida]|uniref:Uncharacterized protein n=1 Tax=Folsomia candida TaxID=158441 RepID=A0A226D553_FOLCA|nr:hypothetical protein Fcan01_25359 [Folsomia candida]
MPCNDSSDSHKPFIRSAFRGSRRPACLSPPLKGDPSPRGTFFVAVKILREILSSQRDSEMTIQSGALCIIGVTMGTVVSTTIFTLVLKTEEFCFVLKNLGEVKNSLSQNGHPNPCLGGPMPHPQWVWPSTIFRIFFESMGCDILFSSDREGEYGYLAKIAKPPPKWVSMPISLTFQAIFMLIATIEMTHEMPPLMANFAVVSADFIKFWREMHLPKMRVKQLESLRRLEIYIGPFGPITRKFRADFYSSLLYYTASLLISA